MNAIELLKADHASVQALFRQYEAAENQPQQQRALAEQIFTALEVHAALEEELFSPAVRAQLGTVTVEEEPTDAAKGMRTRMRPTGTRIRICSLRRWRTTRRSRP